MYRCTSDFKKGYQPRTNIEKNEKGYFFTDSHNILARCWNNFYRLLTVQYMELVMLGRQKYIQCLS